RTLRPRPLVRAHRRQTRSAPPPSARRSCPSRGGLLEPTSPPPEIEVTMRVCGRREKCRLCGYPPPWSRGSMRAVATTAASKNVSEPDTYEGSTHARAEGGDPDHRGGRRGALVRRLERRMGGAALRGQAGGRGPGRYRARHRGRRVQFDGPGRARAAARG